MEWRKPSPTSSRSLRTAAAEESALSSRVADITPEALQTPDQLEEVDVWLMEEGDDSVFYSDEDQSNQGRNPSAFCDFGGKKNVCRVNSVAHKEQTRQRKGLQDPGTGALMDRGDIEMQNEASLQFALAEHDLQTAKSETVHASESAECRNPDVQQKSKLNASSDAGRMLFKMEEEEKLQQQMPLAELQTSGKWHLKQEQEAVQDYTSHSPAGPHHDHSPGRYTLPLPKTSGQSTRDHNSFDHLASSKYSTVSYRRIRRGNTRQKIKDFEYMIVNM